jgi:hypothetical protein
VNKRTHFDEDGKLRLQPGEHDVNVVSYNPHLLCACDAHVHTTIVSGTRAIPYVLKYVGKGDDGVRAALRDAHHKRAQDPDAPPVDVVKIYQKYRRVCSFEALMRFLQAPIVNRWPPVVVKHSQQRHARSYVDYAGTTEQREQHRDQVEKLHTRLLNYPVPAAVVPCLSVPCAPHGKHAVSVCLPEETMQHTCLVAHAHTHTHTMSTQMSTSLLGSNHCQCSG